MQESVNDSYNVQNSSNNIEMSMTAQFCFFDKKSSSHFYSSGTSFSKHTWF